MLQWWMFRTLMGKVPFLVKLLLAIISIACLIGGVVHLLEPLKFPTLFDGIWWALVTVSTVGYGDFVPVTIAGRALAILLIFVGVGVMTLLVTTLASIAFATNQSFRYGELAFLGEGHIIVIGWNERSKHTIENVREVQPGTPIVLIDETLTEAPPGYKQLHFVKGNSSEDAVLKQANIGLAQSVLITAKQQGNEFTADARTILTTLAVKSQNRDVYTIVEILTKEQLENAYRAGADECIESTTLTGAVLVSSLLHHHMSDVVGDLLKFDQMNQLSFQPASDDQVGYRFIDVLKAGYDDGELLIGLKRRERVLLHPPAETLVQVDDELIMIIRRFNKVR